MNRYVFGQSYGPHSPAQDVHDLHENAGPEPAGNTFEHR
jgi:hypothetical protein